MGKAPAFQFYVRDWLSDPAVRRCSASTRGIWIDLLCCMWEAPVRGELTLTTADIARMTGATTDEAEIFLQEAEVTQMSRVTWRDNNVTLENRRMVRERNEKEISRLSSQRYREKRHRDVKVTAPSSTSSSTASSKKEKNMSGLDKIDPLRKQAVEVIEYLNEATNSRYRLTGKSVDKVIARLREGFTVEDCKAVVDGQRLDPYFLEHPKYFRPQTLFGSKFEGYLSAAPKQRRALETDPKRLIKDMRAEAEVRRFVEDSGQPKQIGGENG